MATRIYTRTGDAGQTGLIGGERLAKDAARLEATGSVDELSATLGSARVSGQNDPEIDVILSKVQVDLFVLGSDIAAPASAATSMSAMRIAKEDIARLERWIDHFQDELPPLTRFILPGGHPFAAALHLARTVCRRAERRCVSLSKSEARGVHGPIVPYLNRLSDLLFVLARVANQRTGTPDVEWNGTKGAE